MAGLVPLNNAEALAHLHEAGVEELYVGFHDDGWTARFGSTELNRMSGFGREANPFSFEEMLAQVQRAQSLGMRAFVCFNASSYGSPELEFIASAYLGAIADAGASGIIVSGQALIGPAREAGLGVVMSTVAGVFNERLAVYYRDLGATRLILPRDLSVDEIAGIMRTVPEVEYEVFLMRNGCMFSDSHCLGCHRAGAPSLCTSLREGDVDINLVPGDYDDAFLRRARSTEWLLNMRYHKRTCGLCALWRFEQIGVHAYKVVGRGDDPDDLVADAALVVRNTALARASATEADYHAAMELPRDPSTLCATNGLSCYYPESRRFPI
ncbi:MAG: U32 family peptidase [Eggerthellaceae bacterium]|nr:U32 family peptidase [Eggerthellaceae bacterium]